VPDAERARGAGRGLRHAHALVADKDGPGREPGAWWRASGRRGAHRRRVAAVAVVRGRLAPVVRVVPSVQGGFEAAAAARVERDLGGAQLALGEGRGRARGASGPRPARPRAPRPAPAHAASRSSTY
jgi:hypothetical protein